MTNNNYVISSSKNIADLLISQGLITEDQVLLILREQQEDSSKTKQFKDLLLEFGFITEALLTETLASTSSYKRINLSNIALDPNLINKIPKPIATMLKVVAIEMTETALYVATNDSDNITIIDQLYKYFPKNLKIILYQADEYQIHEIIDQYYGYQMTVDGILREIEAGSESSVSDAGNYVNPTVRLVDAILVDAIKQNASDIHFSPESAFLRIRYRIDGKLSQIRVLHKSYWARVVIRIKILAGINISETRNPQGGRISYNIMGKDVNFRVATQPTIYGENIVIRILDQQKSLVPIDELGFSENNNQLLMKSLQRHHGIIVVAGPTGSGKSTTLYSLLKLINSIEKNIMTLEDPVEYQLPIIRQSNVRDDTGMNFHDGIKSMMRQDPDIIFIGEVRDADAASLAIRAAMTGHQVFTSIHANDAIGTISRILDLGVSEKLLAGSIIAILAQRLARKLCQYCKTQVTANEQDCRLLGKSLDDAPKIFQAVGCAKCKHHGYRGRIVLSEIMTIDDNIDEFIATGVTAKTIMKYLNENGFISMTEDGVQKVLSGIIDLKELVSTINMTDRL